jgi:hypothetical protein
LWWGGVEIIWNRLWRGCFFYFFIYLDGFAVLFVECKLLRIGVFGFRWKMELEGRRLWVGGFGLYSFFVLSLRLRFGFVGFKWNLSFGSAVEL